MLTAVLTAHLQLKRYLKACFYRKVSFYRISSDFSHMKKRNILLTIKFMMSKQDLSNMNAVQLISLLIGFSLSAFTGVRIFKIVNENYIGITYRDFSYLTLFFIFGLALTIFGLRVKQGVQASRWIYYFFLLFCLLNLVSSFDNWQSLPEDILFRNDSFSIYKSYDFKYFRLLIPCLISLLISIWYLAIWVSNKIWEKRILTAISIITLIWLGSRFLLQTMAFLFSGYYRGHVDILITYMFFYLYALIVLLKRGDEIISAPV